MRIRTHGTSGPLLIVLHGGPAAPGEAAPIASGLCDKFLVLEPWQRESGEEPLSVARHVEDLHTLVQSLGRQARPALIGESWGAMLALAYAAAHPQSAGPLVLVGCGTFDPASRARMNEILQERTSESLRKSLDELESEDLDPGASLLRRHERTKALFSFDPIPPEPDPGERREVPGFDARAHEETWRDMLRLQETGVYPAAFTAIRSPVLMLHGAYDPHPGPSTRDVLRSVLPHLEYREWERCGHSPWNEREVRDEFFLVLSEWLLCRMREGSALRLSTRRLELVASTQEHLRAELRGTEELASLLGARIEPGWPPGEYDRTAMEFFLARLESGGAEAAGWYGWYALRRPEEKDAPREPGAAPFLVAAGGYLGPPDETGEVEVGYSVAPGWRGRGYATELVAALVKRAQADPRVRRIVAHTTEANAASRRTLEKAGFRAVDLGADPRRVRFERIPLTGPPPGAPLLSDSSLCSILALPPADRVQQRPVAGKSTTAPNGETGMPKEIDFSRISLKDALDFAVLIEDEAEERYLEFAEQMETYYSPEAAKFFRYMAANEMKHGRELRVRRQARFGDEAPVVDRGMLWDVEAPTYDRARAFMTARVALEVALDSEIKAHAFFTQALPHVQDPEVQGLFRELQQEEVEHQDLVLKELEKQPPDSPLDTEEFVDEPPAL